MSFLTFLALVGAVLLLIGFVAVFFRWMGRPFLYVPLWIAVAIAAIMIAENTGGIGLPAFVKRWATVDCLKSGNFGWMQYCFFAAVAGFALIVSKLIWRPLMKMASEGEWFNSRWFSLTFVVVTFLLFGWIWQPVGLSLKQAKVSMTQAVTRGIGTAIEGVGNGGLAGGADLIDQIEQSKQQTSPAPAAEVTIDQMKEASPEAGPK